MKTLVLRVIAPTVLAAAAAACPAQTTTPAGAPAASPPASEPMSKPPATQPVRVKPVNNPPFAMFKDAKLPMIQRSVLNGVSGRIDHMGVDLVSNRLYVAAKNQGSVEMLDVANSKQQPAISGLAEPLGLLVVSDRRKLVVSCGGDNSVRVFSLNDAGDPTPERSVSFEGETDPIRYDPASGRVFVGHGVNLGSFDLATGERGPSVKLPGMPEGFVVDPASNRVYVNIPSSGQIVVIDRGADNSMKIADTWTIKDATGNYPMAMDLASGHLFVVCRNPAKLVVFDTRSGKELGQLDCTGDADDCWWDPLLKRVYVSCGGDGGFVEVYSQSSEGGKVSEYSKYHQERTNVGCRTSVWVPEQRRLIVAAPSLGTDPTFIYVFFVGP